jgi:hypothetical protein
MDTHSAAESEAMVRNPGKYGGGRVPHSYRRRGHRRSYADLRRSLGVERWRGGARVSEGSGVTLTPGPANELVFAHPRPQSGCAAEKAATLQAPQR